MNAKDKLRRALDYFAVNGKVVTHFDTDEMVLTINNIPFLPSETHALNILYRDDVGYQNFMAAVTNTPHGAEAKRYISPIFDLRSSLYEKSKNENKQHNEETEKVSEPFTDGLITIRFPHMTLLRGE